MSNDGKERKVRVIARDGPEVLRGYDYAGLLRIVGSTPSDQTVEFLTEDGRSLMALDETGRWKADIQACRAYFRE